MEKINVRVPQSLLAQSDDVWEERGYATKSEFIRDALRNAVTPPTQLSAEALEHLAESREQTRAIDEILGAPDITAKHKSDHDNEPEIWLEGKSTRFIQRTLN
jgi:metal-responsive CopG/Arc/MetJ family transcriptional regulator